jgi:hypothetical protein
VPDREGEKVVSPRLSRSGRRASAFERLSPLLVAFAAALLQLPFFDRTLSVMDEGHILMFADIVANGGELYRDATLLPLPGSFYFLALAFKVFGPSIVVARWIALVEFALLCSFAFAVLRRAASPAFAWGGVLLLFVYRVWAFPHWHIYSYSTMSLCLLAGGLVCLIRFLEDEDLRWLGGAGFVTGLAVLCKQDYGVAGLVAMNLVLIAKHVSADTPVRPRIAALFGWYNGAAVAVGAVTAIHFLRQGLLLEMLQQTVLNHLIGIASFDYSSLPPLLPLFEQSGLIRSPYGFGVYIPVILFQVDWDRLLSSAFYNDTFLWDLGVKLFFYAPYFVAVFGGARLWWLRRALRDPYRRLPYLYELALYALAGSLIAILNKPVDYVHVAVLYWPFLCLLLVYTHALVAERPRLARTLGAIALVPALAVVGYSTFLAAKLVGMNDQLLRGDRGGIYVLPAEERIIGGAVEYVLENSEAGQPVAVIPYYPLISFLADRRAPHRAIYTFWPIEYIPGQQQQIIEAMEAADTSFLIYHFTQFVQFPPMEEYAPELFAYLVDTYEMDRVISGPNWGMMLAGLTRREGPPEGRPLVAADAANATLAIESPDGARVPIPPEKRDELLETALWPFRPVVALRPLTGGRRSVMTIPADVPTGSRLQTAVGVHPKRWFKYPPARVTFQIWAVDGGERTLLRTRTINPQGDHRDRHWFEIDVPLDAHAGRRIDLEFTTETNRTDAEIFEMGGWAIPRLSRPRLPGHDPLIRGLEAELRPQRIHDHEDRQQQRVLEVEEAHEPVGESPVQEAVVQ